jgi:hypothetical protein
VWSALDVTPAFSGEPSTLLVGILAATGGAYFLLDPLGQDARTDILDILNGVQILGMDLKLGQYLQEMDVSWVLGLLNETTDELAANVPGLTITNTLTYNFANHTLTSGSTLTLDVLEYFDTSLVNPYFSITASAGTWITYNHHFDVVTGEPKYDLQLQFTSPAQNSAP